MTREEILQKYKLPTTTSPQTITEPRLLCIFAQEKIGKTSNLMGLPGNFLVDLEGSLDKFEGMGVNVKNYRMALELAEAKKAATTGATPYVPDMIYALRMLANKIKKANAEYGKPIYKFITLDTLTVLDDLAEILAHRNFKASPIGQSEESKKYTNIVREMGYGYGQKWHREAFDQLLAQWLDLPEICLICTAHARDKFVRENSTEIGIKEVDLTGKLRDIMTRRADGTGLLYRKPKTNENHLSFELKGGEAQVGVRQAYLDGKDFLISTRDPDTGIVTVNWDEIFPYTLKNVS